MSTEPLSGHGIGRYETQEGREAGRLRGLYDADGRQVVPLAGKQVGSDVAYPPVQSLSLMPLIDSAELVLILGEPHTTIHGAHVACLAEISTSRVRCFDLCASSCSVACEGYAKDIFSSCILAEEGAPESW